MMRRARTIKPEFFTSEDVLSLSINTRLTFIGLLLYVDDYGNGSAIPGLVKAAIYPLTDAVTGEVVEEHLLQLAERDMITFYTVNGRQLLRITNWDKHQRVDRPSRSNIPADPGRDSAANEGGVGERARARGLRLSESLSEGTSVGTRGRGSSRDPNLPPLARLASRHRSARTIPVGHRRLARRAGTLG